MKKNIFKAFGVLAIIAILALNVSVVLDSNSTSVLKWDLIGKILSSGTESGSGSEDIDSGIDNSDIEGDTSNSNISPNDHNGYKMDFNKACCARSACSTDVCTGKLC